MRSHLRHTPQGASLSGRGQLLNTFGAFGAFIALTLLAFGLYLIDQQFANPMQSTDTGLILAAVLLATSIAMFSAILRSNRKQDRRRTEFRYQPKESSQTSGLLKPASRIQQRRGELAFCSERYVDHTQLRLLAAPQARGMAGK